MDTLKTFTVWIDEDEQEVKAKSIDHAMRKAKRIANSGDWGNCNGIVWVDLSVYDEETDTRKHESYQVVTEPDCAEAEDHDWNPVAGGCDENPGVWGHGGGVIIHEICKHCNMLKITNTWAQRVDTGEQGLTSVEYVSADEHAEEAA